jgi:hypothetical protein
VNRIWRIFADWAIVFFGRFFSLHTYRRNPIFVYFFPRKKSSINFDKDVLGYILGDFIASSSDHPDKLSPVSACEPGLPDFY